MAASHAAFSHAPFAPSRQPSALQRLRNHPSRPSKPAGTPPPRRIRLAAIHKRPQLQHRPCIFRVAAAASAAVLVASVAHAAPAPTIPSAISAVSSAHAPLGERLVAAFQRRGVSDEAIVVALSALPVVELRAGVPVGFMLGLPPLRVFALAVCGNMLPVFALLYGLRLSMLRRMCEPFVARARRKAGAFAASPSLPIALALFVGVPLPGTGAVTGSIVAFVLDMPVGKAVGAIGAGVLMSACIMTLLSAMGRAGAAIALFVMLGLGTASIARALYASNRGTKRRSTHLADLPCNKTNDHPAQG